MATVTQKNIKNLQQIGGVPFGNLTELACSVATVAGVWTDSDLATAIQISDKLRLMVLPAGMKICDYTARISAVFTASSTMKIGFEYVDGVDVTAIPQDDDYFCAATTMATAAILRPTNTAVKPITLPKDAYLILTNAGAIQAATSRLDISVYGVLTGQV